VVTVAWGLSLAARLHRRAGPLPGVLAAAGTLLLVAPVSWSHYYVWVAALLGLTVMTWRTIPLGYRAAGSLCVLVVFARPIWWLPHGHNAELHYTSVQQVLAASYVIATLGLLGLTELYLRQRVVGREGANPIIPIAVATGPT
jgi:alpha-1,2-mannosyltransferase